MSIEKFQDKFQDKIQYLKDLILYKRLLVLLDTPIQQDEEVLTYLKSRGFEGSETEIFSFEGKFFYPVTGKTYKLEKSIVIPLRWDGTLRGVWIRSIKSKVFYIWMIPGYQKFWVPENFNPKVPAYLCESIFDALALRKLRPGINICSTLGVSLAPELLEILNPINVLVFDNDLPGKTSMLKELQAHPEWGIMLPKVRKDINELLVSGKSPEFFEFNGIMAKVFLRSVL